MSRSLLVSRIGDAARAVGLGRAEGRVGTWSSGRLQIALAACVVGFGTAMIALSLGAPRFGAMVYSGLILLALAQPAAIAAQVVYGELILAWLMLGADARPVLSMLPLVVAVIITAELLAIVARLDTPVTGGAGDALNQVARSAVIGGAVFGVVALTLGLPTPGGLLAVLLGSSACIAIAVRLWRAAP